MTAQAGVFAVAAVATGVAFILVSIVVNRALDELAKRVFLAEGIADERGQELADALAANKDLHARNERLHRDMAAMRERLPKMAGEGICGSKAAPSPFAPEDPTEVCILRYGHASDWHEAEGGMRWTYRLTPSAPDLAVPQAMVATDDFSANLLAALNPTDPDTSRPYIPTYEEEGK